jgi:histidinol dehydrogenase
MAQASLRPHSLAIPMKIIKEGDQRLFDSDAETAAVVTRMLLDLERDCMDAVRRYSFQFDDWAPASFRLSDPQIAEAIAQVSEQAIRDTEAGADSIYVLGGVPALALMVFGLDGNQPVDVLCGAGNRFVVEAKRQLFGRCGIDLLAGPTEILVIADDDADPALVACDLLGQAEHDPNSGVCLICLSEDFARRTLGELERQLAVLPTREVASLAWRDHGMIYAADSEDEAVQLSDRYAPEHLELHVRSADEFAAKLTNYGSLFIGEETTVGYGDKTIGTNHILPTSRAARYTGGVWVGKVFKDLHLSTHDDASERGSSRGD